MLIFWQEASRLDIDFYGKRIMPVLIAQPSTWRPETRKYEFIKVSNIPPTTYGAVEGDENILG